MRRLHLRILYTINSSSYILARSTTTVPVTPINGDATEVEPYGAVSFKTCLEAICRSSPELMQDRSRDFSVYVLDPLESNAAPVPMDISSSNNGRPVDSTGNPAAQARGVAVGMGFMSLGLSAEEQEPVTVVGTLSKTGAGQDALEVIIALRETAPMVQSKTPSSSNSWNTALQAGATQSTSTLNAPSQNNATTTSETLATIASIHNRTKARNKPKKPPRVSSTPMTQSDKLLSADTYIGPVKKKGRPKGASNNEVKVKVEESVLPSPGSQGSSQDLSNLGTAIYMGTSTTAIQSIPTTNPLLNQLANSEVPSQSSALDLSTLALLFSTTRNEAAWNAFLLNTLNLIDSPTSQNGSQPPVNIALVDALRQLLDNAYAKIQLGSTSSPPSSQSSTQPAPTTSPNDDDIILLDKENINPATFQRRAEQEYEQAKLADTNTQENITPTESTLGLDSDRPIPQSRGLGARSIENSPPKVQPLPQVPSTNTNSLLRKRTLDDCMEERDNKRNRSHRNKGKEKERFDRKECFRFLLSQQQSYRHYPHVLASATPRRAPGTNSYYRTPIDPWTSPPRPPRQEDINLQPQVSDMGGTSRSCPIVIPDSPQAPRVSASSPIKPLTAPKKYVLPTWARTSTATQPRLSEEAQRAAAEAEERRKEEKRTNRRRSNAVAQERSRQRCRTANLENENGPNCEPSRPSEPHEQMRPPPLPIVPQSDLPPIIASSNTSLVLSPPSVQRARSPSPTREPQAPPVTPKRPSKIAFSTPGSTAYDDDSLFTPISIARRSIGAGGSPLFSPDIFGSPLARKNARITSPTAYRSISRQFGSESSTTTIKVNDNSEDTLIKSKTLTQDEQDESPDDLDCPPSSLPIASSDTEADNMTTKHSANTKDADVIDNEDYDLPPRKQHWVGLPPSSPPPPSSPSLMPIDDDIDSSYDACDGGVDEELPVASETDEAEDEPRDEVLKAESDWAPSTTDAEDLTITLPNNPTTNPDTERGTIDELAFLEQFTTIGSTNGLSDLQDAPQGDPNLADGDLFFPSGLDNMDLKGFWEVFKQPNQDGTTPVDAEPIAAFDLSALEGLTNPDIPLQAVDHKKLAADLQALLSGCVV